MRPAREVRAVYDDDTITVYQAFSAEIARPAVAAQRFVPPFKRERMTWIKPSFLWMMYRSGWATKPGQERVLRIRITRAGFEAALRQASLSHYDPFVHESPESWRTQKAVEPVRVQWDPERDRDLNPLPWRSLQVGIGGRAVAEYVDAWVTRIEDITTFVHSAAEDPRAAVLPDEQPYPLPADIRARLGAS